MFRLIKPVIFFGLHFSLIWIHAQQSTINWDNYPIWENTTKYSREYHVNKEHKDACDTNSATKTRPLLTIKKALELAQPGEKIVVHSGLYREIIEPPQGGSAPNKMISIEAAIGEEVIISGSKILETEWVRELKLNKKAIPPSITKSSSRRIWMTTIDENFFENALNPFAKTNLEEDDYAKMPWIKDLQNNAPYSLTRGLIFQDGRRMTQLNHYGDLIHVPGSFWVDTDFRTIHIHPFESDNPNEDKFEIAIHDYLLKPQSDNTNFIQVKGLIFEHCANGFLRQGTGAISTLGGHHWIFEQNVIRNINSTALEIGIEKPLHSNQGIAYIPDSIAHLSGYINVRNNKIYACGTAAIRGVGVSNAVIANNEILACGWQEAEMYGECAGIKLMHANQCLLSNNLIHHIVGGAGIWLYWNTKNTRISRNIIHNMMSLRGGISVEASAEQNLIDNNIIWGIDGIGIGANNSSNQRFHHNLLAYTSESIVQAKDLSNPELDSLKLSAKRNYITHNMFIDFADGMDFSSPSHQVTNNVFAFSTQLGELKLKKWQAKYISERGTLMRADASLNTNTLMFKWNSKYEVQSVPSLKEVNIDFTTAPRVATTTIPGPFNTLSRNIDYYVPLTVD